MYKSGFSIKYFPVTLLISSDSIYFIFCQVCSKIYHFIDFYRSVFFVFFSSIFTDLSLSCFLQIYDPNFSPSIWPFYPFKPINIWILWFFTIFLIVLVIHHISTDFIFVDFVQFNPSKLSNFLFFRLFEVASHLLNSVIGDATERVMSVLSRLYKLQVRTCW